MLILALAGAAQCLVVLDVSIVNVALPSIRAVLGLSAADSQWVVNAYALPFAGLLLLGGRPADVHGCKRVLGCGLGLFTVASLAGGTASAPSVLIGARAAQGVGAALLAPATLTLLTTAFGEDDPRRTRALALWTAVGTAGGTAGNLLGGALTEYASWRWTLLVNVPVGVLALLAVSRLPRGDRDRDTRSRLDLPGAVLATGSLVALTYGITRLGSTGPFSFGVALALLTAVGLLVAFVLVESRFAAVPLLPLRLLRTGSVGRGNIALLLAGACLNPMWFFLSFSMQDVLQLGPLWTGLGFLPHTLLAIAVGVGITPRLMDRWDPRTLVFAGALTVATGFLWQSALEAGDGYLGGMLGPAVVVSVGSGLFITPLTAVATAGVPDADAGAAAGLLNTAKQLGGALGLAALVAVAGPGVPSEPATSAASAEPVLATRYGTAFVLMAVVLAGTAVFAVSFPRSRRNTDVPDRRRVG